MASKYLKEMSMAITYIGIGSNIGSRKENCLKAIELLEIQGLKILARSSLYETSPIGYVQQDWFINCVIKGLTQLPPKDLLLSLKAIEHSMGRKAMLKWGPRLIDLDILLYEDLIFEENGLSIPHKYLMERLFVLEPLVEIDLGLVHPASGISLSSLHSKIKADGRQIVNKVINPAPCPLPPAE